jgi:hypothetical protein
VRLAMERGSVVIPWAATGGAAQKALDQTPIQNALAVAGDWHWLQESLSEPTRTAELADDIGELTATLIDTRRSASSSQAR